MIVVFGSINVDLVAQVDSMPAPGETLAGSALAILPGGKGANQALAARRAGAQIRMFGAVGRDAFAAVALANLETSGIDLSGVTAVDAATGVALIHVDAQGENAITVIAGATDQVDASRVPENLLEQATTLIMQLEVPLHEVDHAHGTCVILNAAPATALPPELLRDVDVLVVNASEAAFLAATLEAPPAPDAFAHDIATRFGGVVIVTLGARGAIASVQGERIVAAAPTVIAVDTTDRRASLRLALAEGVAAGALACTVRGAQAALPDAKAIRALAVMI